MIPKSLKSYPLETRLIVTENSSCRTFLKGDHVYMCLDGVIVNKEAKGFMCKDDVPEDVYNKFLLLNCIKDKNYYDLQIKHYKEVIENTGE